MLYFPMWEGNLPEWLPIWGGKYFTFFNAIFNGADSYITIGVISTIYISTNMLFQRKINPFLFLFS